MTVVGALSSGCTSAAVAGEAPVSDVTTSGLLSSHVTEVSGCGSADWPWVIDVGQGQTVNVTLYDFSLEALASTAARHRGNGRHGDVARTCKVYATIRDGSGSRSSTICGGRAPVSHVFMSTSSRVEVRLLQPAAAKVNSRSSSSSAAADDVTPSYFLLGYQGHHTHVLFTYCFSLLSLSLLYSNQTVSSH